MHSMNSPNPNLLTLLDWSRRLAAGTPCAEWEAWYATSPDAARQWERIVWAEELLATGMAPKDAVELGAADVASYLEQSLSAEAVRQVEEVCWRSPAQLAELASAARFCQQATSLAEPSAALTGRLLEIGSRAIGSRAGSRAIGSRATNQASSSKYRLVPAQSAEPLSPALEPLVVKARRQVTHRQDNVLRHWPLAAAAAVLIVIVAGGAIGWFIGTPKGPDLIRPPVARDSQPVRPAQEIPERPPLVNRIVTPAPSEHPQEPAPPLPSTIDAAQGARPDGVASSVPTPAPRDPFDNVPAPQRLVGPQRPSPPDVTIYSPIGALLVDPGQYGRFHVASGRYTLAEPLRLVSLAESWSSVEIPEVGKVICDGAAEATIGQFGDGVLEVQLTYGKLGIDRLPAGRQIRFQSGGAQWLARGIGNYSSLAVIHDPATPSLFVPSGAVAVDQVEVGPQQIVRFAGGVAQPAQPLAANMVPAVDDLVAGGWLMPPDEARCKKWQAQNGKLLERLTAAQDAAVELPRLLAASSDARQAALLAQWNVSIADEATRVKQTWAMLTDRRELVRRVGVRYLLDLPAGDSRLTNTVRYVRIQVDDATGDRVAQWLQAARQPGQIAPAQAVELAEFLTHRELALRQLAVSLLELHSAQALARSRRMPPDYDAAGPIGKRSAAQREWRLLIRQLFAPARNGPAAVAPNLGARPAAGVPQKAAAPPQ